MSNIEIAKQAYKTYAESNREMIEDIIAEDFLFTSPLDNQLNRKSYFERCWPNCQSIEDFNFVRMIEFGDEVVVIYDGLYTNGKKFRNTEILTIKGEKLVAIEVYFGWNIPHDSPIGSFIDAT